MHWELIGFGYFEGMRFNGRGGFFLVIFQHLKNDVKIHENFTVKILFIFTTFI